MADRLDCAARQESAAPFSSRSVLVVGDTAPHGRTVIRREVSSVRRLTRGGVAITFTEVSPDLSPWEKAMLARKGGGVL